MSKILAILLVVAMLATVFVGCGKENGDTSSTTDDTSSTTGDTSSTSGNTNSPADSSKTSSLSSDWPKDVSITFDTKPISSDTTNSTTNSLDEGWSSWYEPEY